MINLANCYENGKGCNHKSSIAFGLYQKAALMGNPLGIIIEKKFLFNLIFRYGKCCSFL